MSRWQEIVRDELRKAGPSRAEKREAMKRASRIYRGTARSKNPDTDWLKLGLIGGGVVLAVYLLNRAGTGCPACGR